jgi:hypothetical protein
MLAELKDSISKGFGNSREDCLIPGALEDVFSAGLCNEVRLNQKLSAHLAFICSHGRA